MHMCIMFVITISSSVQQRLQLHPLVLNNWNSFTVSSPLEKIQCFYTGPITTVQQCLFHQAPIVDGWKNHDLMRSSPDTSANEPKVKLSHRPFDAELIPHQRENTTLMVQMGFTSLLHSFRK